MRRGGGLRRQGSSGGGSGRRFSTQTSGGGNGFGTAPGGGGGAQPRPGLSHTGGSGRRGGRRPQVAELSDQEIRNMVQSSNAQYTVGLQLDVDKVDVLTTNVRDFDELLKDPDQEVMDSNTIAVKTIPLAVFGLNNWEELIEFQRAVAGLRRPTRVNHATGQEAEATLECRARVSCDTRLMEWSYELSFSPTADDILWKFTNELLLQLRSAGIYGRPVLPLRGSKCVTLASAFSRVTPFQTGGAQRLEWSGEMLWNQIVVHEQLENVSAIVQSTQLPAVLPGLVPSSDSSAPPPASLRYPTLVPLVDELLAYNAKTRRPAVVILRGIPGSGKSTFGKEIATICKMHTLNNAGGSTATCEIFSADRFFIGPRGYVFDGKSIGKAHDTCKQQFEDALRKNKANIIIVDNTHTHLWEYEHYADRALSSGCCVQVLEMRCPDLTTCIQVAKRNSHGVSLPKVIQMYLRWETDASALSFTPQFEHAMINKNPISRSPASTTVYVGLFISSEERAKLLSLFPPVHANVFAEHVTIFYRPTKSYVRNVEIGEEVAVTVTELVQDDRGQTLRVELASELSLKLRNKIPHVTISTRQDVSAYYSNDLLEDARANRIALSGEQRITIKAHLGVAVLAQNQRSITLTSPFGNPGASSQRPSGCGAISNIIMVCVDGESLQRALSIASDERNESVEKYLLARLALYEQIQHHTGSSCTTRHILCLSHNGGSSADAFLKNLEELLLLCSPNRRFAFDKFVVVPPDAHEREYVIELLKQQCHDAGLVHPVKKITVLTTLSDHFSSTFAEDECFQSVKVSTCKLELPSLHADPHPNAFTAPFALTLAGVMDCLNLGIQERTRHDIHIGTRLARDALQKALGRDSSDTTVVERFDTSLVGLDAEVIDLCALTDDMVDLDLVELQRRTIEALAVLGVKHSLVGREPGRVHFKMCTNAASSPVFRLQLLTSTDGESSGYKRLLFCRKQRELVQYLPETETYTTLVALLRAMLRSHCLPIAGDFSLAPIVDLLSEKLVLEFLLQSPKFKPSAVGEPNESGESVEEPDIVRLLFQLLEFLDSWPGSKWSNELVHAQVLFGEGSTDRIQQSELVGTVKTCLDIFNRFDLETRGAIYRPTGDKCSTELLRLLLALVQRNSEVVASFIRFVDTSDFGNPLDAFALCDAMRGAAAKEDVNPLKDLFVCTPSLLVPKRVKIVAVTQELLERTVADMQCTDLDGRTSGL